MTTHKYGFIYDAETRTIIPTDHYFAMKTQLRTSARSLMKDFPFTYHTRPTTLTEEKGFEPRN